MSKLTNIEHAINMIKDGNSLAIGGNVLHRSPMALVKEIVRQNKKNLKLIKTAGAMDVDMLCLGECVQSVDAGFIGYENLYGLAANYRKQVQNGIVKANEHACYTVISALRAASYGVGFMPVKGLTVSDLIEKNTYFKRISDPFTGEQITVVQTLVPDVAIIHVQQADEFGNAQIFHPKYDDILISRAAKKIIISAEKIVNTSYFKFNETKVDIPHFLVDAVVEIPKGAAPTSCSNFYDINKKEIEEYLKLTTKQELDDFIAKRA